MKTIHIFIIFVAVVLFQLFVPAQMIFNRETVLNTGVAYKFRTEPVDPHDPFRGKYIVLRYNIAPVKTTDSLWERKKPVYASLTTDSLGFAKIDAVSKNPLEFNNKDFIEAEVARYNRYTDRLSIRLPFNRYYMDESKAYDAEIAVRKAQRDTLPNNTYALVYVKNGEAVLADVLINEISIKDYVEKDKQD